MSQLNLLVLSMFGLILGIHPALAATFAVGSCKPNFPSFTSISAAVSAVPSGSTVLVCPGTYNEQVTITQPLTLKGIASGNSGQAVIAPPVSGLATNAVDEFGTTLALQLWVDNVSGGPVDISNITVDGTGNGVTTCYPVILGIFYENSSGTANEVTIRNQNGNGCGEGFLAEGGGTLPTVTLQNSSIHDVDTGIFTENQVAASIKANNVANVSSFGVFLAEGGSNTVSGNIVTTGFAGIVTQPTATGSVSGNTVTNTPYAIETGSDGISVTSNKVSNSSQVGINVGTSGVVIQTNVITNSNIGINYDCNVNPNVIHNTIQDAQTGILRVPSSLAAPNKYFNVATIRTGGC
jgi:parallel beta-helix repeat protein